MNTIMNLQSGLTFFTMLLALVKGVLRLGGELRGHSRGLSKLTLRTNPRHRFGDCAERQGIWQRASHSPE
ncbi:MULTISPECIES: hypothetical protein [unclassified Marinovum]